MTEYYASALLSGGLGWGLDEDERETKEIAAYLTEDEVFLEWFSNFQFALYDWNNPEFLARNTGPHAYRTIPLTQGYFMTVSPHDYERMTRFPDGTPKRWCVCMQRDPRSSDIRSMYACRRGRNDEPPKVYAHRELIGCLFDTGIVDHKNGWGLDNRRGTSAHSVNLRYTTACENTHNAIRVRRSGSDLPRGVELRRRNKRGLPLYGGIYCKRAGKKVRTVRSKRLWLSPELAGLWYRNQMKKLHQQRTAWAHDPASVSYPEFPPFLSNVVPF